MKFLPWLLLLFLTGAIFAQSKPAADLIIRNARIWMVDSARPEADAVAILGDRIVAVGSNAEVDVWRGPATRIVDGAGKRLLPGFNDAHVHFTDGGAQLDSVQLNDATSAQEFARRIAERATKTAKDEWLLGGDWDETKWNPPQLPTKELIDPVTPKTPVAVNRYDGHMILANSVGLATGGSYRADSGSGRRGDRSRRTGESDGRVERRGCRPCIQSNSRSDPRAAPALD